MRAVHRRVAQEVPGPSGRGARTLSRPVDGSARGADEGRGKLR